MATVKFRIKNQPKDEVSISVYLSIGKGKLYQCKTGFYINPKNWKETSQAKGKKKVGQYIIGVPKQNDETNKKLFNDLNDLQTELFKELNKSQSKGEIINRYWLENKINKIFNRVDEVDQELLTNHIQYIIDNASTRQVKGRSKLGITESRVKGYKRFKGVIENYEEEIKQQIRFIDIDKVFETKFKNWLLVTKGYSINYSGKQLSELKTVCLDAKSMQIPVNPHIENIMVFKKSREENYFETLSEKELLKIKETPLTKNYLINARKWLLIGCYIGQRGGDLLNITKDNIKLVKGRLYVEVKQQKGVKPVTIPVLPPIKHLIENDLPKKISNQKFNDYIKEICKESGIDEIKEGELKNPITNRKEHGFYPKYKLMASHVCRRSFATNFYKKIPTPYLMKVTGHTTESMFLHYIGKPEDQYQDADMMFKFYNEIQKDIPKTLKVVG
jgi:integrase